MGNIGIWQLLIIVTIVVLLFGTKKLRNLGGDLGSAVNGFKKAVTDDESKKVTDSNSTDSIVNKSTTEQKESSPI